MVYAESIPRVWRERIYRYRLIGGRCRSCGAVLYPPRPLCPRCGGELEEVKLPERGVVVNYTVVRSPPSEYDGKEPYIVAVVELENGARVLAQLTDVNAEEVAEGMAVEAVLRRYIDHGPDGVIEYGIKFRPVK